jgi:hypothetical protein
MTDQLLFGENFKIQEVEGEWYYIERSMDGYLGWITGRHFLEASVELIENIQQARSKIVDQPFARLNFAESGMWIPGGSVLPFFDTSTQSFTLDNTHYKIESLEYEKEQDTRQKVRQTALKYENAPYLWGGKTIMGIDCSGFIQVVYRICGIGLPRDSQQQLNHGHTIGFIKDARPGDLAFFDDEEGEIVHIGIMLSPERIIHASGRVRIDPIDHQGIYRKEEQRYSHKLRVIKNVID